MIRWIHVGPLYVNATETKDTFPSKHLSSFFYREYSSNISEFLKNY